MTEVQRAVVAWFNPGAQVLRLWHSGKGVAFAEIVDIERISAAGVAYVKMTHAPRGSWRFKLEPRGKYAIRLDRMSSAGVLYPRNGGNVKRFKSALTRWENELKVRADRRSEYAAREALRKRDADDRDKAFKLIVADFALTPGEIEAIKWAMEVNARGEYS